MSNIGEIIRRRRIELGLKGYELARKIGVHQTYITYIELHGKVPSPSVLQKIEKELGIDLKAEYIKEKIPAEILHSTAGRRLYDHPLRKNRFPEKRLSPPYFFRLPSRVRREFSSPESQRLLHFVYHQVETHNTLKSNEEFIGLLKGLNLQEARVKHLYQEALNILHEMMKDRDRFWDKFILDAKRIEALIPSSKNPSK